MLTLPAATTAFTNVLPAVQTNLVQAATTRVAEVSIVGFDKRLASSSVHNVLGAPLRTITTPLRAMNKAIGRMSNAVSMVANDIDELSISSGQDVVVYHKSIGDYGFDPLGLGSDETFVPFREAEIKHGRLAMLAAVAWPLQEIFHPFLVDTLRNNGVSARDMLVETGGFSPSLLNGGLEQWEIVPSLALAVYMASVLEFKDVQARKAEGLKFNEYKKNSLPGDLRFDPLRITRGLSAEQKVDFLEKELLNGRLAMIAVTCYVAEEMAFSVPVVQFTPDLFQPLIFASDFRAFMDSAFAMASMDGSINGIAY